MPTDSSSVPCIPRRAYLDRLSVEATTGRIRPKYKLAIKHQKDLDQFLFYILNGSSAACVKNRTFEIKKQDWELITHPRYLRYPASYIDLQTHAEVTSGSEISTKRKRKNNRPLAFEHAGTLKQFTFAELLERMNVYLQQTNSKSDSKIKQVISSFFTPARTDFAKKYGI